MDSGSHHDGGPFINLPTRLGRVAVPNEPKYWQAFRFIRSYGRDRTSAVLAAHPPSASDTASRLRAGPRYGLNVAHRLRQVLERRRQLFHAASDPALDRPFGRPQPLGYLDVAETPVVGQGNRFTLVVGQTDEGCPDMI